MKTAIFTKTITLTVLFYVLWEDGGILEKVNKWWGSIFVALKKDTLWENRELQNGIA
jgi:hypothetical protein